MYEAKYEVTYVDFGSIVYSEGNDFDRSLGFVKNLGGEIITAEELACMRLRKSPKNPLFVNSSFVKEGSLFVPSARHKRYLLRDSLVLRHPSKAVEAHNASKEYTLGSAFNVQRFLGNLDKSEYFVMDDLSDVPAVRFGEDERTVWLFGKQAKDYGLYLADAKISQLHFDLYSSKDEIPKLKEQKQPFANQLLLTYCTINDDKAAAVNGCGHILSHGYRVRGVIHAPVKEIKQINDSDQTYKPGQVLRALGKVTDIRVGSGLERKVAAYLKRQFK